MRKNSGQTRLPSPAAKPAGGQVVLIILLIMIVGLTVGLAVIARSVTNLKISTQTEESQRAFSAAEAGVESALLTAQSGTGTLTGAQYTVTVKELSTYSQELKKGERGVVWLVGHDSDGNPQLGTAYYKASSIDICWGPQSPIPALEVTIIYKDGTKYKVARGAYDPADPPQEDGRRNNNKFDDVDDGNCANLPYKKTITFSSFGIDPSSSRIILEALHLKPIYNNAQVAAQGKGGSGGFLPSQGKEIISEGTAGQTVRKIKTVRAFPSLPEIFDYVLFSGTNLAK